MKEIKLSQRRFCKYKDKYVALVDDEDFEFLNQFRWCAKKGRYTFYAERAIKVDGRNSTQYMHQVILNSRNIDHIDRNGLNNQRSNLRLCNQSQNSMNTGKHKNCTSAYKGVYFHKRFNKWASAIRISGKRFHLGYFTSEVDAAKAYNAKAIELFCEFANLNKFD